MYCTICTLQYVLNNLYCKICTVQYALHNVYCTIWPMFQYMTNSGRTFTINNNGQLLTVCNNCSTSGTIWTDIKQHDQAIGTAETKRLRSVGALLCGVEEEDIVHKKVRNRCEQQD